MILFQFISYSSSSSFIAIFGGLTGVADIGLYFTASAVCLILIRPFSGRIIDRFGLDKPIISIVLFYTEQKEAPRPDKSPDRQPIFIDHVDFPSAS